MSSGADKNSDGQVVASDDEQDYDTSGRGLPDGMSIRSVRKYSTGGAFSYAADELVRIGIRTIGEFRRLSDSSLLRKRTGSSFGKASLARMRAFLGAKERQIDYEDLREGRFFFSNWIKGIDNQDDGLLIGDQFLIHWWSAINRRHREDLIRERVKALQFSRRQIMAHAKRLEVDHPAAAIALTRVADELKSSAKA